MEEVVYRVDVVGLERQGNLGLDRLVYKYNILERVLVENIIPRNVIINRGAAEVDNHISRDDFSTSNLSRMLYLFYYTEHYSFFLTMVREFQRQRNA